MSEQTPNKQPKLPSAKPAPAMQKLSLSAKLFIGLNFVLCTAIIAALWYGYQHQLPLLKQNIVNSQSELKEDNTQLLTAQTQLKIELNQVSNQLNGNKAALSDIDASLKMAHGSIRNLANRSPNDWLAAEAQYLVRMAGRKLWLEYDVNTSLALLKEADLRIKEMHNIELLPLRKALANDILTMKNVTSLDIEGSALMLDGVIAQLDELSLNASQQMATKKQTQQQLSSDHSDWRNNLALFWQSIMEQFVTITVHDGTATPILSPNQVWFLRENIRLRLLRAQLALYRGEQATFSKSIATAMNWLNFYFDVEQQNYQQSYRTLELLKDLPIHEDFPKHFQVTPLLRQLVDNGSLVGQEGKQ